MIQIVHVDSPCNDVQILGCRGLGNVIMTESEYKELCSAILKDCGFE